MAFYIVGELYDMYCVFDSQDQSCEYIERDKLKSSGVKIDRGSYPVIPFYKLRALYNLRYDNFAPSIEYTYLALSDTGQIIWNTKISVILHIGEYFEPDEEKWIVEMRQKYGYYSDLVPRILLYSRNFIKWDDCYPPSKFEDNLFSFIIPPLMLNYVLRLFKNKEFEKFACAFNGLFTDKVRVCDGCLDKLVDHYEVGSYKFL